MMHFCNSDYANYNIFLKFRPFQYEFQKTKYSLERSFKKELENQKKIFLKFFRKTLRSNLKQKF